MAARDAGSERGIVVSPQQDYALIDFGEGRRLERFGPWLLDRPAPQANGPRALPDWSADWVYDGPRAAAGCWTPGDGHQRALPDPVDIQVAEQRMRITLGNGGQTGLYPEHLACWSWLGSVLSGRPTATPMLNLFAASGGASVAAARHRATVTHVDALNSALNLARANLSAVTADPVQSSDSIAPTARILREDVVRYVERCRRRQQYYPLIILDPPTFGRGPKGQTWSLGRDLPELLDAVVALLPNDPPETPVGLWVSTHTPEWDDKVLSRRLGQALDSVRPGASRHAFRLGVATADGRVLASGHAVTASWS